MIATIERHTTPPIRTPGATEFFETDIVATITLGAITADVVRHSYWDPRDGLDNGGTSVISEGVGVEYEVHINGLPETCGLAKIVAQQPDTLIDLAMVCPHAAALLIEAQRSKG